VAAIGKALGMTVLCAERKGVPAADARPGRTEFTEVLQQSTVLIVTCPLNDETRNIIRVSELQSMPKGAVLINVARGGVINEDALVQALKEKWIVGAAADVFDEEPASTENNVLVRAKKENPALNLTLSPHIAWYASTSLENLQKAVLANVEAFVAGKQQNVVV
jgi:lactate dehydrogenase-like 2-hydroxyacid dehydrogenase